MVSSESVSASAGTSGTVVRQLNVVHCGGSPLGGRRGWARPGRFLAPCRATLRAAAGGHLVHNGLQ
eukprot:2539921-Alexandrium_andersonii.AAC.1